MHPSVDRLHFLAGNHTQTKTQNKLTKNKITHFLHLKIKIKNKHKLNSTQHINTCCSYNPLSWKFPNPTHPRWDRDKAKHQRVCWDPLHFWTTITLTLHFQHFQTELNIRPLIVTASICGPTGSLQFLDTLDSTKITRRCYGSHLFHSLE